MRCVITALAAGLLTAFAAFSPALAGPAWWRVSDGASTLWILGVPDVTLTQFPWDDTSLKRRLGTADRLYDPTLGAVYVRPPPGPLTTIESSGGGLNAGRVAYPRRSAFSTDPTLPPPSEYVGPWAPPRSAFKTPPDLLARVKAAADKRNRFAFARLRDNETLRIGYWLDQTNWPKGAIGNAVTWRAFELSQLLRVPLTQITISDPYGVRTPQAVQETCLRMILEESESGLMRQIRADGLAAWARGDLEHALKRGSDMALCMHGQEPSTDAGASFERTAFIYYTVLDDAFTQPKRQSVAIVHFDPLLANNGVLAHYRQLGYEIKLTDGMGE